MITFLFEFVSAHNVSTLLVVLIISIVAEYYGIVAIFKAKGKLEPRLKLFDHLAI